MTRDSAPPSRRRRLSAGLLTAMRLGVGVLFVWTALTKLGAPYAFARAVHAYDLVGDPGGHVVASTLPWLELLVGLCLLCGVLVPASLLLATAMLAAFTVAQTSALFRDLSIGCGCFGANAVELVSPLTVARTTGLMAVATVAYLLCVRSAPQST